MGEFYMSKPLKSSLRPYKTTYLILIHLFRKIGAGGGILFLFFTHQDARKSSIWNIFLRYLVKGRYCARAVAINFIEAACKNWDGRG